ncbi:MAG: RagB/SusD family nutrient uptake outer membrane protein [Chitinophagales bacterium]|nr:RagB/SusD family nutrient uptake outer membrane protein [Chitinophagales bacterium]
MIRLFLRILIIILGFYSCGKKEWLDEKLNQSLALPYTLADLQALLDNSTDVMNNFCPFMHESASDGHYLPDVVYSGSLGGVEKNAYTWSNIYPYNSVGDWNFSYKKIFYCNIVLEQLEKIAISSTSEQQIWNNVKGQALFLRGKTFFELSQVFAPAYIELTAQEDLGISIRLTSDINVPSFRTSVKETYEQIINDLIEAKDLLPVNSAFKTRANRPSVHAMLARVFLSMEDYVKAGQYANEALNLYNTLIDFNSLDSNSGNPISRFNSEVLFHSSLINAASVWTLDMLIDTSWYGLYDMDDLRRVIYFQKNSDNTVSFKGTYEGEILAFGGLAVDELFLIRAECYARNDKVTEAMNDLNALMVKRWRNTVPFPTFSAVNADDALRKILAERKKELMLRGLRWSDLRRLNRDPRFQITITRTVQGDTFTLDPNSYKYTFPIPDDIIQMTGMQQNPGW